MDLENDSVRVKRPYLVVKKTEKGAAMMETLISLFLLAVGLLGTLAMQVKGVNSNQRAQFATDANILANDMASRILGYSREISYADQMDVGLLDDYNGINTSTSSAVDPNCVATGCSLSQQIQFDEWQWTQSIRSRLPNGLGQIAYASGTYTITVMWNNNQIETPTTNCSGSATDLTCFIYELKME